MIKRIVEISRESAHLSSRFNQLVLKRDGKIVGQIPGEDIGVVLVDHPGVTYTHAALSLLADCGAAVVLCGRDHLPNAMVLPMADHTQVVWRIGVQLAAKRPLIKQLWRQLVRAKIRAQAANLPPGESPRAKLLALAAGVKSGDPTNVEAQAARVYWQHWIAEEEFRRDSDLPGTNAFLNYGYAVVRAAVARAIVAAGLLPALGLHHRNRSNAFCLADDLIEPLRPLVDDRVRELRRSGYDELTQEAKAEILNLLAEEVRVSGKTGPLMVNIHRMVASLVQCYQGESKRLNSPGRKRPQAGRRGGRVNHGTQRVSIYVDPSDVRSADRHKKSPPQLYPVPQALAGRRIYAYTILGLRAALPEPRKRRRSYRAHQSPPSPRWRGKSDNHHRQAI